MFALNKITVAQTALLGVFSLAAAASLLSSRSRRTSKRTIVITGGCGNLGSKLVTHLLETDGDNVDIILLEHPDFARGDKVPVGARLVEVDLGNAACLPLLAAVLAGADAIIHFSAGLIPT